MNAPSTSTPTSPPPAKPSPASPPPAKPAAVPPPAKPSPASPPPAKPAAVPPPAKPAAVPPPAKPAAVPPPKGKAAPKLKAPAVVITAPPPVPAATAIAKLPPVPPPAPNLPSEEYEKSFPGEDEDSRTIRLKYYRAALLNLRDPAGKPILEETARLFGRLSVNRVRYGARYPSKLEDEMRFLDTKV